ncbi:unnamed protein product, partial [Nesidiocoris tenuis]
MEKEPAQETEGLSRKRKFDALLENLASNGQEFPNAEENSSETDDESDSNANEEVSEYEKKILKAIEKRNMLLKALGFEKKPPKIDTPQTPTPRK